MEEGFSVFLMCHMAIKPFAKPTARLLAESQVTHVHKVFGAHALKAGSSYFTMESKCPSMIVRV